MQRRSFLGAMVATAAGLLVPARLIEDDPKRVYSFVRRPLSFADQNAILDRAFGKPKIQIFSGAAPAAEDLLVTEETMLAELEFTGSGFVDFSANRSGTASWTRYTDAMGRSVDMPVTTEARPGAFAVNTRTIMTGAVVSCSELKITPT